MKYTNGLLDRHPAVRGAMEEAWDSMPVTARQASLATAGLSMDLVDESLDNIIMEYRGDARLDRFISAISQWRRQRTGRLEPMAYYFERAVRWEGADPREWQQYKGKDIAFSPDNPYAEHYDALREEAE